MFPVSRGEFAEIVSEQFDLSQFYVYLQTKIHERDLKGRFVGGGQYRFYSKNRVITAPRKPRKKDQEKS